MASTCSGVIVCACWQAAPSAVKPCKRSLSWAMTTTWANCSSRAGMAAMSRARPISRLSSMQARASSTAMRWPMPAPAGRQTGREEYAVARPTRYSRRNACSVSVAARRMSFSRVACSSLGWPGLVLAESRDRAFAAEAESWVSRMMYSTSGRGRDISLTTGDCLAADRFQWIQRGLSPWRYSRRPKNSSAPLPTCEGAKSLTSAAPRWNRSTLSVPSAGQTMSESSWAK